ncbi:MAG: hypothetical protein KF857_04955 [Fimbriimonadaceae bacterium]|nr:hypothetical protein [Fimbriimonadaceae bacterium]
MQRTAMILAAFAVFVFAGCSSEPAKTSDSPAPTAPGAVGTAPAPANAAEKTAKDKELTGAAAQVDLEKDALPLIASRCSACHTGADAKGGLDLGAIKSKKDAEAMKDKLAKAADLVESRRMPPRKAPQLSKEEQDTLVAALRGL